ncbi:histidine phosphatase family protein [Chryseomicrobium palamuruense]|uniref:Histidine phosphatase family protein n=1 Tax=Chryseomicrobium palamuruense TaxID=682973 RepID=A0ABV8UV24_9BACL
MKKIYIIRHCQAEGQAADAKLTELGEKQAEELARFLKNISVEIIISSPYIRAIQTIQPLALQKGIEIDTDVRLKERVLSQHSHPDWLEKLQATFKDSDLKYDSGESSNEATERIRAVVDEILESEYETVVLVTHGNLMSLLLREYTDEFGFNEWQTLSNPDAYLI